LEAKGIELKRYNTTCPFVERVWKKSEKLGGDNFTIIIHGKYNHEETRATFSHSNSEAPSLIVKDITETRILGEMIAGKRPMDEFYQYFKGRHSERFDPHQHLNRIGVVNQTTMLATETQEIAEFLKNCMAEKFGSENLSHHFADTRDTLCYATNDNQSATLGLLELDADLAVVVGGYNSSNTSHLVELCEQKFPTYFISSDKEIVSKNELFHFDFHHKQRLHSQNFIPNSPIVTIALTSGASCPDAIVDGVIQRILSFFQETKNVEDVFSEFKN
jgi:4-hydroxy-3-methylbut-2-enyl diphosphate reductase